MELNFVSRLPIISVVFMVFVALSLSDSTVNIEEQCPPGYYMPLSASSSIKDTTSNKTDTTSNITDTTSDITDTAINITDTDSDISDTASDITDTSNSTTCVLCTQCPDHYFERRPCMDNHNAECQACMNNEGAGHGNEDYLRKCESTYPEDGSGGLEGSGESDLTTEWTGDGYIPVNKQSIATLKKLLPTGFTYTLPTSAPAIIIKEVTESSFKIWWVILILIVVLIAIFLFFTIIREVKKRRKKASEQEQKVPPGADSPTVIEMSNGDGVKEPLSNGNRTSQSHDPEDETTPMFTGNQQQSKEQTPVDN